MTKLTKDDFILKGYNEFFLTDIDAFLNGKIVKLLTTEFISKKLKMIRLTLEITKDELDEEQSNVGKIFYIRIPVNDNLTEDDFMTVELLRGGHDFKYSYLKKIISESVVNGVIYLTANEVQLKRTDGTMLEISRSGMADVLEEKVPDNIKKAHQLAQKLLNKKK